MALAADQNSEPGFAPHLKSGRSRAAFLGSLWSLVQTLVPSLSAAATFFLAAAYLSPEDFGLLAIGVGLVSVALAFSPLAFGEALVQRDTLNPAHADAVFWLTLLFGLISAGFLVALSAPLSRAFNAPTLSWLLPILAAKVPFELLAVVPNAMIIRAMRFRMLAMRTTIGAGLGAAVSITLLLNGFGLTALAIAQVTTSATICAVAWWVAGWRPTFTGRLAQIKDLMGYAIFASGDRVLSTLRLDNLVLGALGGSVFVGLYSFAKRIFMLLADVTGGAISSVTHVTLSSMQDEPEKMRRAFGMVSFATAAVGFPLFAGAALITGDLIDLVFGDKWTEAALAAQVFCLVGFLSVTGVTQGALIRSQGRAKHWFWYQFAQQTTTLLVCALTYQFGLAVMIAVVVAKTYFLWPVSFVMACRLTQTSPWRYLAGFAGPTLATMLMALTIIALPPQSGWSGLATDVFVGVATYGLLIVAFCHRRIGETMQILRRQGL